MNKRNQITFFVFSVLFLALFFRVFRTNDLLRFYYDQGRDALVVHKIIATHQPVLVGPTTGLAGILRGPAYYYIILPAYLIGRGSPIAAAVWLQLINIFGIYLLYLSTKHLFGQKSAFIALCLSSFSLRFIDLSRWLSNPSPILTTVPILIYSLIQVSKNNSKNRWWLLIAFILGLNLQLEIASEFWFIPAILLILIFYKHSRPSTKTLLWSTIVFLLTFAPQVIFDIRHQGILRQGIVNNFLHSPSPSFSFSTSLIIDRWQFYHQIFTESIFLGGGWLLILIILFGLPLFIFNSIFRSDTSRFLLILFFTPLVILSFYSGNSGNFYSYYLMGLLPIFIMFISSILGFYLNLAPTSFISLGLILLIILTNLASDLNFLRTKVTNPGNISLGNQLMAINWIYEQAHGRPFNLYVYVPPVVPYAYDYLFLWRSESQHLPLPSQSVEPLVFTLNEADNIHPDLLNIWLTNQSRIAKVKNQVEFGDIQITERQRL